MRKLRRRADGYANSAGDTCSCGYTGCGADSRAVACTNGIPDPCAAPDVYVGTNTNAHGETHAYGNFCAYANGDAGTNEGE